MKRIVTALFTASLCLALALSAFADADEGTTPSPQDPSPATPPISAPAGDEETDSGTQPDDGIAPCETNFPKDTYD